MMFDEQHLRFRYFYPESAPKSDFATNHADFATTATEKTQKT
jgi:hypothetical protein